MKYDFFISHSHQDQDWVQKLKTALNEKGFRVFDMSDVKPGEPLAERLEEGLRDSKYIIMVTSNKSVASNWAAVELGAALALNKLIVPIVDKDVPLETLPDPIKRRNYLKKGEPDEIASQIVKGLSAEKTNGKKMQPA